MAHTDRDRLLRLALTLSVLSVIFGLALGSVAVGSGIADRSLGVLATGLSVLADVSGSVVLIWRFRIEQAKPHRALQVEARAAVCVALALCVVALVLTFESLQALIEGTRPGSGTLTLVAAALSALVLLPLAAAKRQVAQALHSHSLRGDSTLSAIGGSTALLALLGLLLFHLLGWWWADRVVALLIALVAGLEGRTVLREGAAKDLRA